MLETLRNSMRVPGLRKRLLFTIGMLVVIRICAHIPVPGVNLDRLTEVFGAGGLFDFFDIFAGGAFSQFAIVAMGVTPYINSSIIMQLLTVVIPRLEELQKEGEEGRKKIQQYTRYGAVVLGLVQAFGIGYALRSYGAFYSNSWMTLFVIMVSLTAGTALVMWIGEEITEKGIGNGISLIIFANIVSRLPYSIYNEILLLRAGQRNIFQPLLVAVVALLMVVFVVIINEAVRKIPVEYAKRVVGRRVVGGQRTHLPIRINQAGVIPLVFASSLMYFPITIAGFFPGSRFARFVATYLDTRSWWFMLLNALLIVFFTYFYTAITFNPENVADNIKKNGGFIPGYRPGRPTAEYLERVSSRLTLVGGLFLAAVTILPITIMSLAGVQNAYIGGSSLLIVVSVALETTKQLEAQLVMRHYQGFMRT
ncbi:preprotein translocase subunit SecY [Symbiobacterium thermophilum]|uniref:Protein translocase subunit SecY n=1 Tax=Symbiobacterium thermophilum TaxID=2734 RepID=A0A953LHA9_SYMTR|nr:preprotein translocase subunit SecY [Symbiobacterium thermophilum]MBY6274774.1 preprotein translocase subunit SecY [Symbiobacterium thermophilum]